MNANIAFAVVIALAFGLGGIFIGETLLDSEEPQFITFDQPIPILSEGPYRSGGTITVGNSEVCNTTDAEILTRSEVAYELVGSDTLTSVPALEESVPFTLPPGCFGTEFTATIPDLEPGTWVRVTTTSSSVDGERQPSFDSVSEPFEVVE